MKYSIGEMSKLFDIPITTLRHYDNKGIFKAGYVDKESGYRYYTSDQFELLNNILNLKYSKIPLEKIKEFTEKGDLISLKEMFQDQQEELRFKIEELKKVEKSIGGRLNYIDEIEKIDEFDKIIIKPRKRRMFFMIEKEFEGEEELELLVRELGKRSKFSYSLVLGNVGLIMKRGQKNGIYAGVYLKVDRGIDSELELTEQVEGGYLTVYFNGERKDSSNYYKKIEEYIKENNITTEGPYYEMALVCNALSSKDKKYIRMIEIKKLG